MNSYILSFVKKVELLFWNEEILNIVFVHDDEDNERLDQVLFLEKGNNNVVGLYVNGMNPVFSLNRFYDFDDFNLLASYDMLNECREDGFLQFKVGFIKLIFNSLYNELCGLFLSNADESRSIFLIFMQDAIHLELDCGKLEIVRILNENFLHIHKEQFITYQKDGYHDQWH